MVESVSDWLEIGRVVAPHGLDGAVRVYPQSDFPERFLEPGDRWLQTPGATTPQRMRLLGGQYLSSKKLYVLKFAECCDRTQAEALREARLLVPASDRLPLAPDEFHVADLIGLQVRLHDTGQLIGTVVDLYSAGNDLLAIELLPELQAAAPATESRPSTQKKTRRAAGAASLPILIPFVHAIVPVVDLAAGYVEITPPKGLLPS